MVQSVALLLLVPRLRRGTRRTSATVRTVIGTILLLAALVSGVCALAGR